jgi:hypothetical protein
MTKLESLQDIKAVTVKLLPMLIGSDVAAIKIAETALHQLVDRFYQENEDLMASSQYQTAKKDYEYFIRLVDLALAYYQKGT